MATYDSKVEDAPPLATDRKHPDYDHDLNASTSCLALSFRFMDSAFHDTKTELEVPLSTINFDPYVELVIEATPGEVFDRIFATKDEASFIVDWHKQRESANLKISDWTEGHTLENDFEVSLTDNGVQGNTETNMVFFSKLAREDKSLEPKFYNCKECGHETLQPKVYKRVISFQTKVFDFGRALNPYLPTHTDIFSTMFARFFGERKLVVIQWCSTGGMPYSKQFFVIHRYEFELREDGKSCVGKLAVGFYWIKPLRLMQSVVEYAIAGQTKKEMSIYMKQIKAVFDLQRQKEKPAATAENAKEQTESSNDKADASNETEKTEKTEKIEKIEKSDTGGGVFGWW